MLEWVLHLWPQAVFSQSLVVGVVVGVYVYLLTKKKHKLPPGPSGWPLVGNNIDLQKGLSFKVMQEWSKIYGPVMTIKLGPKPVVILSKIDVTLEALVTKQPDFAGRIYSYVNDVVTGGGKDLMNTSYGPTWKLHRKLASTAIRQILTGDHLGTICTESLGITIPLMLEEKDPFDPYHYLSLVVFNIISGMCFSKTSPDTKDPRFHMLVTNLDKFSKEAGSMFLEEFFPPLRLCHTPKLRRATTLVSDIVDWVDEEIEEHRQQLSDNPPNDFSSAMLLAQKEAKEEEDPELLSQLTDHHVTWTVIDVFLAGLDTSRNTLHWALLALALHKDIQQKVQEEVDQVIDSTLTVSVGDRSKLPYTEAVLHEVMRLRHVAPLGLPHQTIRDTSVGGYTIPKGTVVMVNIDALLSDPDQWEEPNVFKPERFLTASGKMAPKPPSWLPFSAGRRVCLGEAFAKSELHLLLAGICRACDISLAPGTTHDFQAEHNPFLNSPGRYKVVVESRI